MKPIQTSHGFVTLVPKGPLEHLWTPLGYWSAHERVRTLSATDVATLLAESNHHRLVEAKAGMELRWYPRGDYGFWHHHARLHMREFTALLQQPGYVASEWIDAGTGDHVILLQQQ